MKTMKIEKQLLFTDSIAEVEKLQVSDGLEYRHESDGVRAVGPLYIRGQYKNEEGQTQKFQEIIDMDILAPNHKLSSEGFFLQVEEFHGQPDKDGLHVYVSMSIHGLIEEGSEVKTDAYESDEELSTMQREITQKMEEYVAPIVSSMTEIPNEPVIEPVEATEAPTKQNQDDSSTNISEFEDLFEDAGTTFTSYRIIVAKKDDSYDSIAKRYDVNESALRTTNKDKDVMEKTLVILPFQK